MLIVDPHRKYKMTKQILRNNFSPRHLIGSLLGGSHIHQMKFSGIIGNVCQRHIGIKELQSFAFVRRQVRIEYGKQIALRQPFFFLIEVLLHTLAVRSVCNERTSHICVLQTVIDLKAAGFIPVIVENCVSSRKENDKKIALQRMKEEGAIITTYESVLFELLKEAGTEKSKKIQRLIK